LNISLFNHGGEDKARLADAGEEAFGKTRFAGRGSSGYTQMSLELLLRRKNMKAA
jgi:hypothetical protein